jgi:hypothetical protein
MTCDVSAGLRVAVATAGRLPASGARRRGQIRDQQGGRTLHRQGRVSVTKFEFYVLRAGGPVRAWLLNSLCVVARRFATSPGGGSLGLRSGRTIN